MTLLPPERTFPRLEPLLDVAFQQAITIMIVGAGRVGLAMIQQLLSLPCRRLIVIDHDVVSERDRGDVFPAAEQERMKCRAIANLVAAFDPRIIVEAVIMRIDRDSLPRFAAILEGVDLLLWGIDDWVALQLVMPIIYPHVRCVAVTLSAELGYAEVAWSLPGQTACVACALDARRKQTAHGAASLSLDAVLAANLALRVGLGLCLVGQRGAEIFSDHLDRNHSLLIGQTRNNPFTASTSPVVPALTQLVRTDNLACDVCRRRITSS